MVNLTKRKFSHDYLHKINRFIGVEDYLEYRGQWWIFSTVEGLHDACWRLLGVQWRLSSTVEGYYYV